MIAQFSTYYIDQIQEKDAWKLCDFIIANEDRLKRYFPKTLEQNLTPDLSTLFVKKLVKQFELNETYLFTIKEIETNKLVGLIYIKALDWVKKQGEFAYCIGYPFEGKNITTKAITLLSKYAFNILGLETLQIIVHQTNLPSLQVAKNCDFIYIKILEKEHTPPNENPLDMQLYELYKTNKKTNEK